MTEICMADTEYRCVCGATLRYRQDLLVDDGARSRTWKCKECLTPVPGIIGERLGHQHPM